MNCKLFIAKFYLTLRLLKRTIYYLKSRNSSTLTTETVTAPALLIYFHLHNQNARTDKTVKQTVKKLIEKSGRQLRQLTKNDGDGWLNQELTSIWLDTARYRPIKTKAKPIQSEKLNFSANIANAKIPLKTGSKR